MFSPKTIADTIRAKTKRVLLLKGPWGVGKTYFWKSLIKAHGKDFHFDGYSYVSLFGVQDISEIRTQIAANIAGLQEASRKVEWFTERLQKLRGKFLKSSDSAEIPYLNLPALGRVLEDSLTKGLLVCFDDIERKGPELLASSFLGLVSQLKEERDCSIVIIYNEQALERDEADRRAFDEYREKVVDCEFEYTPSMEDNIAIAFGDRCPKATREVLLALGIKNIRVMQRIKWALDYFGELGIGAFPRASEALEFQVAAITTIHHTCGHQIPIENLDTLSYTAAIFEKDDEERDRLSPLTKIKYSPHPLSRLVVDYHLRGYVDQNEAIECFKLAESNQLLDEVNRNYSEIWYAFHGSFGCSQAEWIARHDQFLRDHAEHLKLRDLAGSIEFLNELGKNPEREVLLEGAIDRLERGHTPESIRARLGDRILDRVPAPIAKRVLEKVDSRYREGKTLGELMAALCGSGNWGRDQVLVLAPFSEDDFYAWLCKPTAEDVVEYLQNFFSRYGHGEGVEAEIVSRVHASLKKLAMRSELDRRRVSLVLDRRGTSSASHEEPAQAE